MYQKVLLKNPKKPRRKIWIKKETPKEESRNNRIQDVCFYTGTIMTFCSQLCFLFPTGSDFPNPATPYFGLSLLFLSIIILYTPPILKWPFGYVRVDETYYKYQNSESKKRLKTFLKRKNRKYRNR